MTEFKPGDRVRVVTKPYWHDESPLTQTFFENDEVVEGATGVVTVGPDSDGDIRVMFDSDSSEWTWYIAADCLELITESETAELEAVEPESAEPEPAPTFKKGDRVRICVDEPYNQCSGKTRFTFEEDGIDLGYGAEGVVTEVADDGCLCVDFGGSDVWYINPACVELIAELVEASSPVSALLDVAPLLPIRDLSIPPVTLTPEQRMRLQLLADLKATFADDKMGAYELVEVADFVLNGRRQQADSE